MSTTKIVKTPKEYRCDYGNCDKHYRTKFSLRRHYLAHFGIKQHQCPHCEKRFALAQYLTEHIYTHTGEKPFVCTYKGCNKRFRQAGKLSLHKKKHALVNFSESSDVKTHFGETNCPLATIEAIHIQIASFTLPTFFYSRVLPVPNMINQTKVKPYKGQPQDDFKELISVFSFKKANIPMQLN